MSQRAKAACFIAFVAAFFCLLLPPVAQASEEILSFHADIQVLPDGTLDVTETIEYRLANASDIWGLFRRIPLTVRLATGELSPVTFNLLSVKRGDQATAHKLYRLDDMAELRIGETDVFLPANSVQVYEIRYRTHGHIQLSEQFDGLSWHVTGSNWPFPIRAASAMLFLPDAAPLLKHAAFAGPGGTRGDDYQVTLANDGLYGAATTAPLEPGEGFAVAATWPKGVISAQPPSLLTRISPERLAYFVPALVTALFLFVAWVAVGRDPKRGPILREFEPPEGLGPAAVGYIFHRELDSACFTAAVVSMAVKGALRIVVDNDSADTKPAFRLEPLEEHGKNLTAAEQAAYRSMFPSTDRLELREHAVYGKRVDKAKSALEGELRREHGDAYYRKNGRYSGIGAALGLLAALVTFSVGEQDFDIVKRQLVQWLLAAGPVAVLTLLLTTFWFAPTVWEKSIKVFLVVLALGVPISAIVFAIAYGLLLISQLRADTDVDPLLLASGALYGFIAVVFHELMAAPTKRGRELLDRIEGFGLYLRGGTRERQDYRTAPDCSPELFERLLPYAIALEVAEEWSAQFSGVFGRSCKPEWYSGHNFDGEELKVRLTSALVRTRSPKEERSRDDTADGQGQGKPTPSVVRRRT